MLMPKKTQYYVGVGGLPNALGVVECDAAVMDHKRRYGEGKKDPYITSTPFFPFTLLLIHPSSHSHLLTY